MNSACEKSDLLVFSHLRWDFVFQRPQHLMIRHAKHRRVFYFEEPVFGMTELPKLHLRKSIEDVHIVVPYLPVDVKAELIQKADLMFTGGLSLFEAKKQRHNNIHAIPSSIDYQHFHRARQGLSEPADQINIPHPRIGFYGVIVIL